MKTKWEADSYGFAAFLQTDQLQLWAVAGMFDLLQYGYLPFDEIPFKRSFVETKIIISLMIIILPISNPSSRARDYVDTFDTHPNLKKRRENAAEIISGLSDKGAQNFICENLSSTKSGIWPTKEAIYINLTNHDYGEAFIIVMYCSVKILMIRMSRVCGYCHVWS